MSVIYPVPQVTTKLSVDFTCRVPASLKFHTDAVLKKRILCYTHEVVGNCQLPVLHRNPVAAF